jgi:multidrug efflux system outer membrane protein
MRRQLEQSRNALALLVGGRLPTPLPAGLSLASQNLNLQWGANLSSGVLLRRPDVRAAEQRLMAAHANIGVARATFLPRMQLTGALGSASTSLGGLFKSGSSQWSFTPNLQQPLFDGGRSARTVDLAEARKVQAVVQYEKTLQQAFREVSDLLVARDTLQQQLEALDSWSRTQQERLRLTTARYDNGATSQLEVLDAQRDALTAQQSQVLMLRQLLGTTAQLYKALGGGDS